MSRGKWVQMGFRHPTPYVRYIALSEISLHQVVTHFFFLSFSLCSASFTLRRREIVRRCWRHRWLALAKGDRRGCVSRKSPSCFCWNILMREKEQNNTKQTKKKFIFVLASDPLLFVSSWNYRFGSPFFLCSSRLKPSDTSARFGSVLLRRLLQVEKKNDFFSGWPTTRVSRDLGACSW